MYPGYPGSQRTERSAATGRARDYSDAVETYAVPDYARIQKLVDSLTSCLAELDELGADVAAAHLDSALHALELQFGPAANVSNTE